MTTTSNFFPVSNETHPDPQCIPDDLATSVVWQQIVEQPYKADLFSVLRWLDSRDKTKPLLGRAARPHFEPIRFGQEPTLAFAASTIANIVAGEGEGERGKPPRLSIYSFGLFGPNGPLPLHLTEYARDRLRRVGDPTLIRFADIFHHRLILLFYRAWADSQSTVSLDRPDTDRFTNYIASLTGYGQSSLRSRDDVPDHAKFFNAPHLVREIRDPEGLAKILSEYFQVPVDIQEFVPHWISLATSEQTRLSNRSGNNLLGENAVIGDSVLDAQYKIRVRIGPMPLARYLSFLPGGEVAKKVITWIKNYVGFEFFVDLQLVLNKEEVMPASLGDTTQLGWTSWLDERCSELHADDLVIESGL